VDTIRYQSFVVRIWRRTEPPAGVVRVDVEDLQGGLRTRLTGTRAADLVAQLPDMIGQSSSAARVMDAAAQDRDRG
jgi:hypothetical protein